MAVNVTANWQLIRAMDALLRRSDAGRAVFLTSGAAHNMRAYRGPYSVSKAALEALVRTYAAETASTRGAGQSRQSRPDPHPHARPGHARRGPDDPAAAGGVAEKIVALCLPGFTETGRLYDYPPDKLLAFRKPE